MKRLIKGLTATTVVAVVLFTGWGGATSTSAAARGGNVLPASESPHGYTLTDMTGALALFNTSGNTLGYPNTPFQILYADFANVRSDYVTRTSSGSFAPCAVVPTLGCGWFSTQNTGIEYSNSFSVRPGTMFYVPLWSADDSPPVVGTFPTTASEAGPYFFDPEQVGGEGFKIIVDGSTVPIGPAYVGGPAFSETPLPDGGGHNIVTLGAFLGPMTLGTHTVEIRGGVYGQAMKDTYEPYGFSFLAQDLTYKVTVTKDA